jgi:uncharacterized protein (UPF0332 family)
MTIEIEIFKQRAQENLSSAAVLLEHSFFNASANRAYYAAFHAAMVFLLRNGIPVEPDHRKVQNAFNVRRLHGENCFPRGGKNFWENYRTFATMPITKTKA